MPYAKNLERLIVPGKDEVVTAVKDVLRREYATAH